MAAQTRIKICGVTDKLEAQKIVEAGVDALGFIFVEQSPRNVDPKTVREIVASLPPFVDAVGVFMDAEASMIEEIIHYCGLTIVQLHGDESPAFCENVPCRVIKSFRMGPAASAEMFLPYSNLVSGFLLDTYHEKTAGGTGKVFDWGLVKKMTPPGPIILAGGLTPDNVEAAIKEVKPFAVDLNSGVEISPGRKNLDKVRQAVRVIRAAA